MAQGFIECQPLPFNDFSGGLTDNILQGDPKRYAAADNFLITVDKKLEVRSGTVVYDPTGYVLPGSTSRISGLFTGISESVLFAHANRDLYTQSPSPSYGTAWGRILGPTGNEALSSGSIYNQVTTGDFQRQIYYTSDAGALPGKLFRDQNNSWKAVTAGLPKMAWSPNYPTNSSLITACITLANALRASMVSHFNDSSNTGTGTTSVNFQHVSIDKWSLSYFTAQTWSTLTDVEYPGPVPAPTPAPAATNEATLYALCAALGSAYEHHRVDLAGQSPQSGDMGNRYYHPSIVVYPGIVPGTGVDPTSLGINVRQGYSNVVSTPAKAAAFLDELAQKWYWHQLSPFSHSSDNTYSVMSRYLLTTSKVGTIYSTPSTMQVTPNYADFRAYASWLKFFWNHHAVSDRHAQVDPSGLITLPEPTDFDSAALTIFWARYFYGFLHTLDASVALHKKVTFTTTSGSANITGVAISGGGSTLPVSSWLITTNDMFNDPNQVNWNAARVLSSGAGTATLSRTATASIVGTGGQYSFAWMHGYYVNDPGGFEDITDDTLGEGEALAQAGAVGTDLDTWVSLANECVLAMGAHLANFHEHSSSQVLGDLLVGEPASAINGNYFFVPTVVSYAYAAFYRYQYTVEPNGLIYLNRGSPVFSDSIQTTFSYPIGTSIPAYNDTYFREPTSIITTTPAVTISGIPSLVNTSGTNYDTTVSVAPQTSDSTQTSYYQNFLIDLYRTTNGGTTFYELDQLANLSSGLTQSYLDTTNENYPAPGKTALNLGIAMYTSGGVLANDPPPQCKYILALNGFTYYGAITDTGQFFSQRIRQSVQGAPDAAPATFFDDLEDELTGFSSARSNLIALCKNSVYRVTGSFTSTGQGAMTHERISDSMGCLNARSVVRTEIGVFFAGSDGFYYTDGYQVIKISIDLDKTYRSFTTSDTQKARIYGCYDKLTRRVWWAMQSQETAQDNDIFFVFYLDYGVKPSGVFTKSLTTQSWQPSSACFFQGQLVIGDSRGYLLKTDPRVKTDPKINTATLPSTWNTVYVPWSFYGCALDFGTTYMRKWITRIHMVGQNVGNNSIQVISINDNNDTSQSSGIQNLPPIQYQGNPVWGDARVIWGTSTYAWKYDGKMDLWRRFPARSMRSDFKQIAITPGNFYVYRSDDYPQFAFAQVNSTAKTATITTPSGYSSVLWPLDVVDMYLSFDTDGYVNQYLITAIDATKKILTFADAGNLSLTTTTAKWEIKGVKKEQRLRITAFDVHFSTLGDENQAYGGNSSPDSLGSNA